MCLDIDECAENLHICEQQCSNSIGSYSCSCNPGYRLAANNKTCDGKINHIPSTYYNFTFFIVTDIDECFEGISGCSQYCVNNVGSYYCTCDNGYLLNSDQHTCDGKFALLHNFYNNGFARRRASHSHKKVH